MISPEWHTRGSHVSATGQFDQGSTTRPRQRDVGEDRSGTDVVGGEATARPNKRGRVQTNEHAAGDLKVAAPLAGGHRSGGELRRSGDRTDTMTT